MGGNLIGFVPLAQWFLYMRLFLAPKPYPNLNLNPSLARRKTTKIKIKIRIRRQKLPPKKVTCAPFPGFDNFFASH
jgi:hypothetical protein